MNIRPAQPADIAELLRFEQGVISAERPFNSQIRDQTHYYDLHALTQDDRSLLVVAEQAGALIASGYAQIRESKAHLQHDRHAYLGFMFVRPEYRGQGVNKAVLERLLAWSKDNGVVDCYLDVYAENTAAIRAYEKAGFAGSLLEMKLQLD